MVSSQVFTFSSSDGIHDVSAVRWLPEGTPRGVVQLVHGISEYMGRYDPFARYLTQHGFAVVGHDHLGHGRTARDSTEYGWFADKDGWKYILEDTRTLRELAGQDWSGLPYFLMGHSMGSFVVRGYLMFWPGTVDGAILSGTGQESAPTVAAGRVLSSLFTRISGPRAHSRLLNTLSMGAYNKQFRPNRTGADWISRDTAVVDAYCADPLCRFLPTVSMFHDMMVGLQLLAKRENLQKMDRDTPVYFFSGDKDPVGASGKGVRKVAGWFREAGVKDVTVKLYPEGRHEMLNETNRDQVFQDVLDWLEVHMP
ncbi:alpha/beta hydrolase [Intestinimonas massiliensis (ex Afouda et al. 2020)]|uniref:alpha/beta hydrolase n=1 Tax=Intestinimonas massiliensis (ex Afouda et al. 2020) TaxID=1673721 RepID=UPI00102F94DA|nr:alpha/beta hydrolase [Intestinimonas massiliensis (ex Afouda et al. 2020)]